MDSDLCRASGLPQAFASTKVHKRTASARARAKKPKAPRPVPTVLVDAELENVAEELRLGDVFARYRRPFTVLMSPEERLLPDASNGPDVACPLAASGPHDVSDDPGPHDVSDDPGPQDVSKDSGPHASGPSEPHASGPSEPHASGPTSNDYTAADTLTDQPALQALKHHTASTDSIASLDQDECPEASDPTTTTTTNDNNMHRYYQQRYDLFHLFDKGIDMGPGDEGWWSVTPEAIAAHTAAEARAFFPEQQECTVLDAFCGLGGNAIQFARAGFRVTAVELDLDRLEAARHNAHVYGVAERITFIHGDAFQVLADPAVAPVDLVFMSPPWGGPVYMKLPVFDPRQHLFNGRGEQLFHLARALTPYVIFYLPRQTDLHALATFLDPTQTNEHDSFVVEQHYLRNRLKAISAYFYP